MRELFAVDFKGLFRGLIFSIIGTALLLCLLFLAYSLVFNLITSKPEKVKSILEKSSLYTDLPAVIYDQASKETGETPSEIPLENPEIRQIALDVYSPEFAQSSIENLIDGLYGWLEGNSEKPEINLDFSEKNAELRNDVGKYVRKKASKLPACTFSQLQEIEQYDAFNAKCLPPTVTPTTVEAEVKRMLSGKDSLFQNAKITTEDLKTSSGKPLHENFNNLPQSFSLAKSIPFALAIFAFVLIIIIFYMSESRISALKRISRLVLAAGVLITLIPLVFLSGGKAILDRTSGDEPTGNIVRSIFEQFMLEASRIYYVLGILLILTAAALYVYARKIQNDTDKIPRAKG